MRPPAADAELCGQGSGDLGEVDRDHFHVQTARIQTGEVEEVGRSLRQTLDLKPHLGEELAPGRLVHVLVGQQLDVAAEREDRRPQLVRRVRDELAPRPLQRRQLLAHAVERAGELTQLVGARVHDRLVEAAAGDPVRGALQMMDPPREDAREQEPDESGRKQRDQAGDDEAFAHKRDVLEGFVDRR